MDFCLAVFLLTECNVWNVASNKQFWSFLQMNIFAHIQWVTNVPKSQSTDYPTRIRLECGSVGSGREHILAQEYARILDLHWSIHNQDTELLSFMKQSWLTCHPQWKCHHRHNILWLELLHSFLSCSLGGTVSAFGWTWRRRWVPKLFRYCGRVCGLHSQEAGMWTPIRAHSPTASTSTFGYFSWPSPFCCTW